MNLENTICHLIRFKTETGNREEIMSCISFIMREFKEHRPYIKLHEGIAPVVLLSNTEEMNFDVLVVGHIDVVPAEEEDFEPKVEEGKIFGRGSLDMKSFAAVGLQTLNFVLEKNLGIKFGVLLSTDEEKGSFGLEEFLQKYPDIHAKIVLDVDVAGDINKLITKCKAPVFVRLEAKGLEAHGSTPWEGVDANEKLLQALMSIRKKYPYFSKEQPKPLNTWIDTVHFAKISGGDVANVISNQAEALLDFRLTEKSGHLELENFLKTALPAGVSFEIVSYGEPVVMDEKSEEICTYKRVAEQVLGADVDFAFMGGATDSRSFAKKGSIVIMHSGSGCGMHAKGEFVELKSVCQLAEIQKEFIKHIDSSLKK